jgi:hypothetical protein
VTDESTRSFHDVDISESKFSDPIRTSSRANLLTEIHEMIVEKRVLIVKRTTTKINMGPPYEISMESPPELAVNTRETK